MYRAIIELDALGSRGRTYELFDTVDEILDGGTVHWLAGLLAPGAEAAVDDIIAVAEPVLRDEIEPYWPQWADNIETMAQSGVSRIFQVLVDAGVVEWIYPETVSTSFDSYPSGGIVRLTALGRYAVPDDLPDAGYLLRRVDDLTDAPARSLIDFLVQTPDEQRQMVADAWQPTLDVEGRVRQIVDMIGSSDDPAMRLDGFAALELFDAHVVGAKVRRLMDGPLGGHAAMYLLARGMADQSEVGELVDIGVFVDVLAVTLDDPEELCELFSSAPHSADQFAALERMWQHPSPHTAAVLDALGQHLFDRKLAKAARKAAIRHRSWMANRT